METSQPTSTWDSRLAARINDREVLQETMVAVAQRINALVTPEGGGLSPWDLQRRATAYLTLESAGQRRSEIFRLLRCAGKKTTMGMRVVSLATSGLPWAPKERHHPLVARFS